VSLDGANLTELELRQEILRLRRRVQKLAALLRLMLAVQRAVGFSLTHQRLPDGRAKQRILRAVDQARTCMLLRALLRLLSCHRVGSLRGNGKTRARSTTTQPVREYRCAGGRPGRIRGIPSTTRAKTPLIVLIV
jgi:hypothetical protein